MTTATTGTATTGTAATIGTISVAGERRLTADVRVSFRGVTASEWIKFRSLRSTVTTQLVAVALTVGIGALFSAVTASQWSSASASDKATYNATSTSLNGLLFAQLAIGVLGVMFMSSEYSTGMIRSSLTAVPRRLPVLWAKVLVFVGVVGVVSLVTSFLSFFLGQALLSSANISTTIGANGVLRDVVGSALYVTTAGVIGLALGGLLRNTAAGISTLVAALFVLPPLLTLLPGSISNDISPYLPAAAGQALWQGGHDVTKSLSPWVGFLVMVAWAAVLLVGAAARLRKTDV